MDDSKAEQFIPQKRYVKQTSHGELKPTTTKGRGIGQRLKTAGPVAAAAVGLSSAIFPTQAKNVVEYAAHNLAGNGVVRQAEQILEARYSQIVDGRDTRTEKEISVEEAKQNDLDVDLLYPGLGQEEKEELNAQLQSERSIVSEHYLTDEAMDNIKELEPLIRQVSKEGGLPEDLLLGMVIVESVGNRYAYNEESSAKGLTQMTDEMAETYGLSVSSVDLRDPNYDPKTDVDGRYLPEIILPATVKELQTAYQRTRDWGLAAWEWHAGAPNVYAAIAIYVKSEYGEDLGQIVGVEDADLSSQIAQLYRGKIAQHHINLFRLLENTVVQEAFSGPEWDNTLIYVKRILALVQVYREKINDAEGIANLQEVSEAA